MDHWQRNSIRYLDTVLMKTDMIHQLIYLQFTINYNCDEIPTNEPILSPTSNPTSSPTDKHTLSPTTNPTSAPTDKPTNEPSNKPSNEPTLKHTDILTNKPTLAPKLAPTEYTIDCHENYECSIIVLEYIDDKDCIIIVMVSINIINGW